MRVYISGKISGLSMVEVANKFHKAEQYLRNRAFEPINPVELDHSRNVQQDCKNYMQVDIAAMMQCNHIAFLPCWKESKGARLEYVIATALNYHIIWLD